MIISNLLLKLTTIFFTFTFILISTSIETEKHPPNTTSKVLKPLESSTVKISNTTKTTIPTTSTYSKIGNKTITTKKYNLITTIKISERSKTNTTSTTILIPSKIVNLNLESNISNLLNEKQKGYKNDKENNEEEEEKEEDDDDDDDWPAMPMFKSNLRKPVNLKSKVEELKGGNKKEKNNYLNNSLNLRNNSIDNISTIFNSNDKNDNLTVTKLNNELKSTTNNKGKIFNKITTETLQLTTKISRMDEVTTTEMYERNLINISTSITETSTSKHKTLGNSSPKISNLSTTSASPSNKELTKLES